MTKPHPNADVRMRGFSGRTSVEEAVAWIDRHARALPSETVPLASAAGRVLAADVVSGYDVPGFPRAMMDGFAVRAADLAGTAADSPRRLEIVGQSLPADPFGGEVREGTCVRIMTGAPLPAGSDAVLPVEKTRATDDSLEALETIAPGKHAGSRGEDIARGDRLLPAGRRLRPQDLGVLSSVGVARVDVVRRPRVRIVTTGNELLPPGTPPQGFRITDANSPMLEALVVRDGGVPIHPGLVPDDREAILSALETECEIVLVSGGTSVGQEDVVPVLLSERGELDIHGIAIRPGSPTGLGRLGRRLVMLLPGNPVSCLCAYDFFAGRAMRRMGRLPATWPYRSLSGLLEQPIRSAAGRVDYVRVAVRGGGVVPVPNAGASVLSSTTRADGFVIVPPQRDSLDAGESVTVFAYDASCGEEVGETPWRDVGTVAESEFPPSSADSSS